jgi:parallel beta-helix repeat protein
MNWKGNLIRLSLALIFIFIIIIIVLSQETSAYTPHDPIIIEGDEDFTNQAANEGWAGNGTEEEPYVIEGYEIPINGSGDENIRGIGIESTDVHFTIRNIRISSSENILGIVFEDVRNGTIEDCLIENRLPGIHLWDCSNINVANNTLINCEIWFLAEDVYNFTNNTFINGGFKIFVFEFDGWSSINIDRSNHVNGKPIYLIKDQNNAIVPEDAGQIILFNCTNTDVEDRTITNTSIGIFLIYSSHNTINGNTMENCSSTGIELYYSSENMISNNLVSTSYAGIHFLHSDNNSILNNKIFQNYLGIDLYHSNSNLIFGNNASFNERYGIYCGSAQGHFTNHENSIINNTVGNNDLVGIELTNAERIDVLGNNIMKNDLGINLYLVNNSKFHHNNFINNSFHLIQEDSSNTWRSSHLRGNFWSDYEGRDNTGDGIGDTNLPYQGVDHHPLMEPAKPGDYIEPVFVDEEEIATPDDQVPCILSVILFLIIIVVLILILRRMGKRKEKEEDQKE